MIIYKLNWIFVAATALLFQAGPAMAQQIPSDTAVKISKLPNGLTYYIRKNTTPEKRAILYLVVKAGSLMETDAQRGLAHFTEHMAFNGTKDFPKNELINYLQKAGVRFGSDLNAYTSFGETVYQLPIPTDSAGLFHNAFRILANWAGHISMDGKEIDAERGIIEEEERARGKNAESRMRQQLLPVVLQGTRHANRLPIGDMELIRAFDHSQVRKFYKDWYRPDLMAVIAVGDFDPAQVEKLIKSNFNDLVNPGKLVMPAASSMPDNERPVIMKITDPETGGNSVSATIRFPGSVTTTVQQSTADIYRSAAISLLNKRIGELQIKGEIAALSSQINYGPYEGGTIKNIDAVTVTAIAKKPEDLAKALAATMDELERAIQFGFTSVELEQIKEILLTDNERSYAERSKAPSDAFVQQYLNNFISGGAMPSIDYSYEDIKTVASKMTVEGLNDVVKKMRQDKNIIIIVNAPESEKSNLPSDKDLTAAVLNRAKGLKAYADIADNKSLLDSPSVGGRVIKKENFDKIGVTKWVLSNGVQVYLKPTDFKNREILFRSFSPGGLSVSSDKDFRAIGYASTIPKSGVGDLDPIQLGKFLQYKTATASAYIDDLYQGYVGTASPGDLETAMQLVYTSATRPRADAQVFARHIEMTKFMSQSMFFVPEAAFNDTLTVLFGSYHPRVKKPTEDELDEMSLEQSFNFYKERFADNSGQVFVFVGNFVPDSIQSLIETYIGGLPVTGRKENFVNLGIRPLTGRVERIVRKGIEDKATVNLVYHDTYEGKVENDVQMVALTEILNYRMFARLREKEAGVYTPSVTLSGSKLFEKTYRITISFGCAPGNVDKLVDAVQDEVEKLKKEGATQTEVDKFKAERLRSYSLSEKNNDFWMNYLLKGLQLNDDLNMITGRRERLSQLTPESIKNAASKYLTGQNFIKAVLVPEKKYVY